MTWLNMRANKYHKSSHEHCDAYRKFFIKLGASWRAMLTIGKRLIQSLMKEYESETNHFLYSTFLQQKQLFTVHKLASQGTIGLSHHDI